MVDGQELPTTNGWLGGDNAAMFGVKKEKKWKKAEEKKAAGVGNHLNSDWLGGGGIEAPARQWKKPEVNQEVDVPVPEVKSTPVEKEDDTGTDSQMKKTPVECEEQEVSSQDKKAEAEPETGIPDKPVRNQSGTKHTGWIGGDSASMFGVKKEKKWTKPKGQEESRSRSSLNNDWLGGANVSVKKWKKPVFDGHASTGKMDNDWMGAASPTPKKRASNPPIPEADTAEPEPPSSDLKSSLHDSDKSMGSHELKEDAQPPRLEKETSEKSLEYGVPDKPDARTKHTGWIGGDSAGMFGVKKEKKWTKPKEQEESSGPSRLNNDWLGGTDVTVKKWKKPEFDGNASTGKLNNDWMGAGSPTPTRRWSKPMTFKSDVPAEPTTPKAEVSAVVTSNETEEVKEEESTQQVIEQKGDDDNKYGVPDKPDGSTKHTGWLGGDSAGMFGAKKEKKWTKPKEQEESSGPSRLNNDWLGGTDVSVKKWKKPEFDGNASTGKLNNDWMGAGSPTPTRRWSKPTTPKSVPSKPTIFKADEPSGVASEPALAKEEDHGEQVDNSNEGEGSEYGVPDKPDPSSKHTGWLGGDSAGMFGVKKEKKWTKPKAKEEESSGPSRLNNDWLGGTDVSVKKWKKPERRATAIGHSNNDWIGGSSLEAPSSEDRRKSFTDSSWVHKSPENDAAPRSRREQINIDGYRSSIKENPFLRK